MIAARRSRSNSQFVAAALLAALTASCVHYQPAPLHPEASHSEFLQRRLPANPLGTSWTLDSLLPTALSLHPDLKVAYAHVAAVQAAQITAGESPNPTVGFAPSFATNPGDISPWTLGFTLDIPIETAGKRGFRIAQAKATTDVARLDFADATWKLRSRLRDSLLDLILSRMSLDLALQEVDTRTRYVKLLEARLKAGEAARAEVDIASIDLLTARQSMRAAEGLHAEARAKLAAAIGLPTAGLENADFQWPEIDRLSAKNLPPTDTLHAAGLLNRIDIRRSLADYAAAESALQLEVAKQYPDLHLGPGYTFDQGQNKWELGLSVTIPILNQNGGAIAEAKGRREELAAKFLALQAQVIGDTEAAAARFQSAINELAEADAALATLNRDVAAAQRALDAGEQDRLTLTGIEVQRQVAARLRLDAVRKAQAAKAVLEDAIQKPIPVSSEPAPATQPAST